jgi:hypothetical protein
MDLQGGSESGEVIEKELNVKMWGLGHFIEQ